MQCDWLIFILNIYFIGLIASGFFSYNLFVEKYCSSVVYNSLVFADYDPVCCLTYHISPFFL